MNIKIGIITILKTNNYGAELQAFATQSILKKIGYDAEIIDYLFYKNNGHIKTKKSRPIFNFGLKNRLIEQIYPIVEKFKDYLYKKNSLQRKERFREFHLKNTSMSITYKTIDELYSSPMDYDIYIVGSDQVWNPGIYSSILPYMLTFAPIGKKKISYASSFGVAEISEKYKWAYEKYLSSFNSISVREENAVRIVHELCGLKAEWVLDPTLLLTPNDWGKVANRNSYNLPSKYILLYELTTCPYILQLANYFKENRGLDIVRICKNAYAVDKQSSIMNITDAGPAEFIDLFENAEMIITNSFHGTAFAINFEKDFYTVTPNRKHNNSRQRSLLKLFNLEDRLINENSKLESISHDSINYEKVREKLEEERTKSIDFLINSITN